MHVYRIYRDFKRNTIQKKLTVMFAETMRKMVTDTYLHSSINMSIKRQICIPETETITSYIDRQRYANACVVKLIDTRTVTAAEIYKKYKVCVLNFACSVEPGGGVLIGSVAQEESLCRCSTLYPCLCSPDMYDQFYLPHIKTNQFLGTDDCIFTPDIVVFQTDEFYPRPRLQKKYFQMDVITCSAPALNHTNLCGKSLYELHYKRLIRIMDVAANQNEEVVILGAFGCGAFLNEPHIVAEAMMNVVKRYRHMFRRIVFAIPSNSERNMNYKVFKQAISNSFPEMVGQI